MMANSHEAVTYPPLSADLQQGLTWRSLKYFGAGAIIACVTIGSGETVFASRGGAIYGYTMLWCFLAGALCKGVLVYTGARFITLTARSPLQSWMELPGPRGWFVWFVAVMTCVWMPFWLAGLPGMLGNFSNWVVGIQNPELAAGFGELSLLEQQQLSEQYAKYGRYWGTFYIILALVITWLQTYGFLERLQTLIVALLLFCMLLAAGVAHPNVAELLAGLIPQVPDNEPWVKEKYPSVTQRSPWIEIMVYLGIIGGGAQDYFGYLGLLREKSWGLLGRHDLSQAGPPAVISTDEDNLEVGRRWLLPARIDIGVSTTAILIFTWSFVVLGASVLHPRELVPDGFTLLTDQAEFLRVLAGERGAFRLLVDWVYKTGIFFAFFGTILGAYEIFTRTIHECCLALFPRLERVPLSRFRAIVLTYVGGGGLILLWGLRSDPRLYVEPASLVGSGLICGLWCFAMLWSEKVHLPASLRMRLPVRMAVIVSGLILTVGPVIGLIEYGKELRRHLAGTADAAAAPLEETPVVATVHTE